MPRPPMHELADAEDLELEPVLEPDPLDLRVSISALVHMADSERVRREIMAAVGFPSDEMIIFLAVNHLTLCGAQRATHLAEALQTTRSNISKVARRLTELGLAARTADPRDERGVLIALTPAGRAVGRSIIDYTDLRMRQTLEDWDDQDIDLLRRLLSRFIGSFADAVRQAGES